jgi:hypothetical protein
MREIELHKISLQPLQFPAGWHVVCNQFFDIEPGEDLYIDGLPEGNAWELFLQDMLLIRNDSKKLNLDLGWQPEADPSGLFTLRLIKNEDWSNPVASFETSSKSEIVDKINSWLYVASINEVIETNLSYSTTSQLTETTKDVGG